MPLPGWQEFLEANAAERRREAGGIAVDFACSPRWAARYEHEGLRTGYPRAYYTLHRRHLGTRETAPTR